MAHHRFENTDTTMSGQSTVHLFEGHHRGLKDLILGIAAALEAPPPPEEPGGLPPLSLSLRLGALRSMAELHFADEEKLMDDVGYPERDDHALRHRDFLMWMDRLERVAATDPQRMARERIPLAMIDWWEAHAMNYDRLLADFLCRGGV